jgi:hypothetical protein
MKYKTLIEICKIQASLSLVQKEQLNHNIERFL